MNNYNSDYYEISGYKYKVYNFSEDKIKINNYFEKNNVNNFAIAHIDNENKKIISKKRKFDRGLKLVDEQITLFDFITLKKPINNIAEIFRKIVYQLLSLFGKIIHHNFYIEDINLNNFILSKSNGTYHNVKVLIDFENITDKINDKKINDVMDNFITQCVYYIDTHTIQELFINKCPYELIKEYENRESLLDDIKKFGYSVHGPFHGGKKQLYLLKTILPNQYEIYKHIFYKNKYHKKWINYNLYYENNNENYNYTTCNIFNNEVGIKIIKSQNGGGTAVTFSPYLLSSALISINSDDINYYSPVNLNYKKTNVMRQQYSKKTCEKNDVSKLHLLLWYQTIYMKEITKKYNEYFIADDIDYKLTIKKISKKYIDNFIIQNEYDKDKILQSVYLKNDEHAQNAETSQNVTLTQNEKPTQNATSPQNSKLPSNIIPTQNVTSPQNPELPSNVIPTQNITTPQNEKSSRNEKSTQNVTNKIMYFDENVDIITIKLLEEQINKLLKKDKCYKIIV